MTIDFSETLFRCSSLGHLLTEPVSKADKDAGNLSEGAKTHLVDIYVHQKYDRQTDISNKYIAKGLACEEDGITLYSRVKKNFFKKNEEHLNNDFIKGTPDLFIGKSIHKADTIIDIKVSWDIYTFFRTQTKKINSLYYWQLQGYMWLTAATKATLAYTLVNTPDIFLNDEKRKLFYRMDAITEESPEYIEACIELEKSIIYDDIPLKERLIVFEVERNDADINRIEAKALKAREYLQELQEKLSPELGLKVA
jgi:hypothetical protein